MHHDWLHYLALFMQEFKINRDKTFKLVGVKMDKNLDVSFVLVVYVANLYSFSIVMINLLHKKTYACTDI